ncbi:TPA: DUF4491 family protein [Clostridium botulinum]|uniref:DUF4491 family protein n=1 Tax=Clostridium botulinum TaxID=1491 RepID=UPI000D0D7F63|nr:DUF4491 family protein [Clostridium botulinum]PSM03447.1 DUF4491 domain-containing protein [Clostridium botulinum]HDK7138544.1 DUF4491 family protein [Clostridium botulinum]HDK7141873.1 DUF4491 family protein [Clostridium botulinum]HDK7146311.1 DUF4491 family protein [Clostridium botulinum]HDK7150016.1 DUF4491 family protein [Clostridium botulinum]
MPIPSLIKGTVLLYNCLLSIKKFLNTITKCFLIKSVEKMYDFIIRDRVENVVSLAVGHIVISVLLAVLGFSPFWSIGELRQQKERVKKGWFPKNPKKK